MSKIVLVNAVVGERSTGLIVSDLAELSIKSGLGVITCGPSNKFDYKVGNYLDWKVHAFFTRVFGRQAFYSKFATFRMINYLKKEKPDIIHLHNLHGNYINLPCLFNYISKNNIKLIITLHDCWFFTGKCFHFVESKCEKWKTMCQKCPQKHQGINSIFFDRSKNVFLIKKKMYKNINNFTIVSCSEWMDKLARQSPLFHGKSFAQIYNGIDTNIFCATNRDNNTFYKENILSNKFVIMCFAAKLFHQDNKKVANKFMSEIKDDELLIVVGCKQDRFNELRIQKNVIALPYINDRFLMADIYNSSDVFVNFTLADTLPTVNMESICCGTPVITYNSCGSPELVMDGKTGFVINQFDYMALKYNLERIKCGTITRNECANIGRRMFDKNRQYGKYIELYKGLLMK